MEKTRKIFIVSLLHVIAYSQALMGQVDLDSFENEGTKHELSIQAYADGYLSTYSNELLQSEFQPFETVGARDNTFGVNVAQIGIEYNFDWARANVILHWGDIPQATWSTDFNEIQEANVGAKLADGLWLDAGFFATHVGTESFLPKNNMLSNTAFKTFNEPFYQAGAKLSYENIDKWYFELWAFNGYNRHVDNNDAKSVGVLISHHFSENTTITYTNMYGRENDDSSLFEQYRFYQNIYLNQNWDNTWYLTLGFDYGLQTNSGLNNPNETANLYAGLATVRYQFSPKWSITTRAEIFKDQDGFISGTTLKTNGELTGYELYGLSLGGEYRPIETAYLRAESRYTRAADDLEIFTDNGIPSNERWELLLTMGLHIEKLLRF